MDKYPKVNRAHIVPRTWLRRFADDDEMIGMRLVDSPDKERVISIDDATIRKRFYRRTRPDGSPIDDVEHSISQVEQLAGPILPTIEERWPLDLNDKHILAELFAIQVLRGVRWRQGYAKRTDQLVDEYRDSELFADEIKESGMTPDEVAEHNRKWFMSDTFRLTRMLGMTSKGASVFGSMIWALIRFPRPMLATCDHPVVGWSRFESSSRAKPTPDGLGLINGLEWRVPMSPKLAILMVWLDRHEDVREPFEGGRDEARNINSFTVAQADKQWLHLPGENPSFSMRRNWQPLSSDLFEGYGSEAAEHSALRNVVKEKVNARLGEDSNEYEIVTISPPEE